MNHQQQFQFRQDLEQYIISSNINNILQSLLEDIMINKPKNPIDFMIEKLEQPQSKFFIQNKFQGQFNFVIGPPGLRTFTFLQKVRQQVTTNQYQIFNCGQFIRQMAKNSKQFSAQAQATIANGLMLNDEQINSKIANKIKDIYNNPSNKSIIIEGYPKTLQQAINLQHLHIPPTKIILMNVNDQHLRQICEYKIRTNHSYIQQEDLQNKVAFMVIEYKNNLKQLKEFYNNFSEIDLSKNSSEDYIKQELRRAFQIKTISPTPRTCSQVLIVGSPNSGRTSLAKKFAKYYNLVYISSKALISNQIRKDSITGRKIKQQFLKKQLIDQFTVQKLIEDRINKTDCLMQGFVLEGYPKTEQQYQNIKNLNLRPSLTVVIDLNQQESIRRGDIGQQIGKKRFQKWLNFKEFLYKCKDKMFWVDPSLNEENMFEEVKYQFEKKI